MVNKKMAKMVGISKGLELGNIVCPYNMELTGNLNFPKRSVFSVHNQLAEF